MCDPIETRWILALTLLLPGCGGGAAPAVPQPQPPALAYGPAPTDLLVGVFAPPLVPELSGGASSEFSVAPSLPPGLTLAPDGSIGGWPSAPTPRALYTVTASNPAGSASASFELEVHAGFDHALLLFGVHVDQSRVAIWRHDPRSTALVPMGSVRTAKSPLRAATDPLGRFLYVSSAEEGLGVHRIDTQSGSLGPIALAQTDGGSFELALAPDGRCLYVTNLGSSSVETFRIDPESGALSKFGTSLELPAPAGLAVSPDGRFLAVGMYGAGGIGIFELDPLSGAIGALHSAAQVDSPIALEFSADGRSLYALSFAAARLSRFSFAAAAGSLVLAEQEDTPLAPVSLCRSGAVLAVASADGQSLARYQLTGDGSLFYLDQRALAGQASSVLALPDGQLVTAQPAAGLLSCHSAVDGQGPLLALHQVRPGLLDLALARGPAALAPRSLSLYAAATTSGEVHGFDLSAGMISPTGSSQPCGQRPSALAIDPNRGRLFVAEQLSDAVALAGIGGPPGSLTACQGLMPALSLPRALAISSDGFHLAAAGNDGVRLWRIASEATGAAIAPLWTDQQTAGESPSAVAFHPSGQFAFSADRSGDRLRWFELDPTLDRLAPLGSLDLGAGARPRALDLSRDGRWLAVACSGDDSLRLFAIAPLTGAPSEVLRRPVGSDPRCLAFSPDGRLLALGEFGAERVVLWRLSAPGEPTALETVGSAAALGGPHALAFAPEGDAVWVALFGEERLRRLSASPVSGLLASLNEALLPTGSGPAALALSQRWLPY
jgi:6-phosphogluconolactonase (cycloisomerase 2 family)